MREGAAQPLSPSTSLRLVPLPVPGRIAEGVARRSATSYIFVMADLFAADLPPDSAAPAPGPDAPPGGTGCGRARWMR